MSDLADHWKVVFDTAINSMDFGSGFLDDEEVDALRAAAVDLGVDPMEATPREHRHRFCPGHEFARERNPLRVVERCKHCDVTRQTLERWHGATVPPPPPPPPPVATAVPGSSPVLWVSDGVAVPPDGAKVGDRWKRGSMLLTLTEDGHWQPEVV